MPHHAPRRPERQYRRRIARVVGIGCLLMLAGCAELLPNISLRDDYFGKSIFQPSRSAEPVARDGEGNPIFKK